MGFHEKQCSGNYLLLIFVLLCCIGGCGKSDNGTPSAGTVAIPTGTKPCEHPEYWPYSKGSNKFPFLVHYRTPEEVETVDTIIGYLDNAWGFETSMLGFTAPPSDEGSCGPDGQFDVFVWRGNRTCFVQIISEKLMTPWGGRASYMILDPWGPYGGDILEPTIGHEFNHACHAADDWHEIGDAFEMTASYVEQYFGDACTDCIKDFQARPEWSLIWYDDYETWYMYGAALYLYFLRGYYFPTDETFPARFWHNARNIPDPLVNKPNFVDALDSILLPIGSSFADSVVKFARWRYYAGARDDGRHFRKWPLPPDKKQLPFVSQATLKPHEIVFTESIYNVTTPPMLLGSSYIEIAQDFPIRNSFQVSMVTPVAPGVRWVVQAVPGIVAGSDGETIDLSGGSARVSFADDKRRTLIITPMPATDYSPELLLSGNTFPFALRLAP
jgi:hypothetical protein